MDHIGYLEKIRLIPTLSGYEDKGAQALLDLISPMFDESRRAGVAGLLFTKKCKKKNAPLVLIDAHLDEIGMIVTDLCENGMLTVSGLGGMDMRTVTAQRFVLHANEDIEAVSVKRPFVLGGPDARKLPKYDNFFLYTGLSAEELKNKGVCVGTPVSFVRSTEAVGNGQYAGPYMDDKSCAVAGLIAVDLLKDKDLSCNVGLLLSAEEESFGAGFKTGAFDADPSEILVVDVDFGQTPEVDASKSSKMGEGPSVCISIETDRKLTKELLAVAKEKEIPVQPQMSVRSTGTNASAAPFLLSGVPTAVIGLPLKYMHTPAETLKECDLENTGRLIAAYIEKKYGKGGAEV